MEQYLHMAKQVVERPIQLWEEKNIYKKEMYLKSRRASRRMSAGMKSKQMNIWLD